MSKKISLVASAMLLSSTVGLADSASIKDAFKNGSVSGDISVYTTSSNTDDPTEKDSGYTAGTIGINYETDTFQGFTLSAGFRAGHEFTEDEEGDYEDDFAEDSLLHTAAIAYANDDFSVSVGRQEIDLEWLGDYNEAAVIGITAIPDTTVVLGYTDRQAEAEEDEISDFEEITEDGTYVVDIKNSSIPMVELNPYYYNAPDEVDFYGLKATLTTDYLGFTAHYANSNIDSNADVLSSKEDGNILHLEASTELAGISLAAGYITTDSDGGIGGMDSYGDNIDPSEEIDDAIYGVDADTFYGSIGYEILNVELTAFYADAEYDDGASKDLEATELSLGIAYNFTEELEFSAMYSDVEVDNIDSDVISASLVYSF